MYKKLLSILVAALMVMSLIPAAAFAGADSKTMPAPAVKEQTQITIWDFETDPLEDGWQFIDSDGDGNNWERTSLVSANSGTYMIGSASYSGGALSPDNWAVTPVIDLPDEEQLTLSFFVRSYSASYPETYRIYVGTSDDIEAMEPVTEDLLSPSNTSWEEVTADLSDYAGQSVYLAFRHYNCYDQWRFFIDDVAILSGEAEPEPDPTLPPVDPPAEGEAVIVLNVPNDVWGDGSGYQMLMDADATAYGSIIPTAGGLTTGGDAPAGVYEEFEYKIPENADGSMSTSNIIVTGTQSVNVPAGTYDWCITNPTPGDRIWIASANGNIPGRYDDYEFEANKVYTFTVTFGGENDQVDLTIQDYDPDATPTPEPTPEPVPEDFIVGYYFETEDDVNEWTYIDADGDGYNWYQFVNASYASEGQACITSASYLGGALTPDNWAISPEIEVPAVNPRVTMYLRGQDPSWAAEHFAVYVGTGEDVDSYTMISEEIITGGAYECYEFDLSEYVGETISVAVRHFNITDMFRINLDEVEFWGEYEEEPDPTEPPVTEPPVELITEVDVIEVDIPEYGANPDFEVTVPEDAHYTVDEIVWVRYDDEGDTDMTETDVFDNPDASYYAIITVLPEEGWDFAEDCIGLINGDSALVDFSFPYEGAFFIASIDFTVEEPVEYTLDEALNVEGGEIHFESEGDYPWVVVNDEESGRLYAMSGNAGVHSSSSTLTATITANAGDVVTFEFQAWGEGTSTFWDKCDFKIDGVSQASWGKYQHDWESFTSEPMTAGEHTLTWIYTKDSSVSNAGDCFMVDNVEITEGELPPSGILGDVDLDGDVDTADALMALRYLMGLIDLNEDQLAQAEVTGDGNVSMADSLLILRKAMELIDSFPAEEQP